MNRLVPFLVVLQISTLAAVATLGWGSHQDRKAREPLLERGLAQRAEADRLLEARRYGAARYAYDRLAQTAAAATDNGLIVHAQDGRDLAAALALVARETLPDAAEQSIAASLSERLQAIGTPPALAASAVLDVALHRAGGSLPAARARAEAAVAAGHDGPWLQWHLGALNLTEARTDEAASALELVVKAAPDFAPALHRLGLTELARGRKEAAIQRLQQAMSVRANPETALDLARVFLGSQMWAESITWLESVLRSTPDHLEALRLLASAQFKLNKFVLAADLYRKAWRLAPEPRTLLSAAIALHGGAQNAAALATLDQLAPYAAQIPEIHFERALVLTDLGQSETARQSYRAYIAAATGLPDEAERIKAAKAALGEALALPALGEGVAVPALSPPVPMPAMPPGR